MVYPCVLLGMGAGGRMAGDKERLARFARRGVPPPPPPTRRARPDALRPFGRPRSSGPWRRARLCARLRAGVGRPRAGVARRRWRSRLLRAEQVPRRTKPPMVLPGRAGARRGQTSGPRAGRPRRRRAATIGAGEGVGTGAGVLPGIVAGPRTAGIARRAGRAQLLQRRGFRAGPGSRRRSRGSAGCAAGRARAMLGRLLPARRGLASCLSGRRPRRAIAGVWSSRGASSGSPCQKPNHTTPSAAAQYLCSGLRRGRRAIGRTRASFQAGRYLCPMIGRGTIEVLEGAPPPAR